MPTLIDLAQLHPVIDDGVINLNSLGCQINFLSGTRNHDIPIGNGHTTVTMPGIPHLLFLLKFEVVDARVEFFDQLFALEHRIWQLFVVTTADHEDSGFDGTDLDHLEVVGEVALVLDVFMHQLLLRHIVDRHCF